MFSVANAHKTFPFALVSSVLALTSLARAEETDLAKSLIRDEEGRVPREVAGFRLISVQQGEAIHYVFTLDPSRPIGENLIELTLTPRDEARPAFARSASFNIEYRGPMVDKMPSPAVRPLADAVVAAIIRNDPGGILLAPPRPKAFGEGGEVPVHVEVIDRASAWTGIVLVLLFLFCLPWTARWVAQDLKLSGKTSGSQGFQVHIALASVVVGLAVRLLAPHLPVMYYMGYHLADTAGRLEGIPKYGPGALALYHLIFQVTGTDHLAMMYANSVLGSLTPLAGGALLCRLGIVGWGPAGAIVLLALSPIFIKDATTESLLVPTTLWVLLGLVLFLRSREDGRTFTAAAAHLHLLLAMLSRPEAMVLVPLSAGLLLPFSRPRDKTASRWTLARAALWLVGLGILAIRIAQLAVALEVEFARGNNPVLRDPAGLLALIPDLWRRDVLLWPSLFPSAVTTLAVLGMILGPRRLSALALNGIALAWIASSLVDLPYVSIPRVQVPGAVFCTLAAGIGVAGLYGVLSRHRVVLTVGAIVGTLLTAYTMAVTVPNLWAPTNSDDEERLLRDAREAIPKDQPFILVRRGYSDAPKERLHLYYPDYWFEPPARDGLAVGPDWFSRTDLAGRAAYFLLGTRCYMRACGAVGIHPACQRMHESYSLEALIERTVPVRDLPIDRRQRPDQDLDFPWCLTAHGGMKIGLYRITASSGGS